MKKIGVICVIICMGLAVVMPSNGLDVGSMVSTASSNTATGSANSTAGSGSTSKKPTSLTSDSIKEKEEQIDKAEKEKESLKGDLSDLKQIKKELESKKQDLKAYVEELDKSLAVIEQKITDLKTKIADKEIEITQTENELAAAIEMEENQKESMIRRIRLMYGKGETHLLDMLLQSGSLGEFLNRADFIESVMDYDHMKWEEYITNRELVELCKRQLEVEKEILDQSKANVEVEQQNLMTLIEQKHQDITAYETDINTKEKAIREYEALIREQDAEIKAWEAAIAEEKKKLLEQNQELLKYDGGTFKFPLANYTRISDEYGMRIHPTLHVEQFHNGVDFAAPLGTAIYAAYDGKVVAATYSATMGNYVMIDHGDNLYTIYMHASALYVSRGDVVVKGETIAAVGSTGRSTGNHLHFGVRKDGDYVSPWNYLSR